MCTRRAALDSLMGLAPDYWPMNKRCRDEVHHIVRNEARALDFTS
jgi:hypothetical protein